MHIYWFFPPWPVPPPSIWIGQLMHFCLVISYPLSFWREKPAAIIMVLSGFVFFFLVVGSGGAIAYFLISVLPAILNLISSQLKK